MKIGMLFPGYGSQFVGMGKELYDDSRIMQEYFEEASNCLNMNFVKLCFASSDAELALMEHAFPALFLVSSSIAALLKQEGIEPAVVVGYNTGEYAAIHAGGGINFPDGLYLLSKYQTWYQELLQNLDVAGIHVKGIASKALQEICAAESSDNETVSIAVYDDHDKQSIMGTTRAVDRVQEKIYEKEGVHVDDAGLEIGLHSSLMDPVALNFKLHLEKVDFKPLTASLITNADAKVVTHPDFVKSALIKQIHSPVMWYQSLEQCGDCDLIIQVGPGSHLSAQAQTYFPEKKCISIQKKSDIDELKKYLEEQQPVQQKEENGI
jgi:[acyl-carrier-protein] S-malonyltransferase